MGFWINFGLILGFLFAVLFLADLIDKQGRLFRAMEKFPGPPVRPIIGSVEEIMFLNQGKSITRREYVMPNSENLCSNDLRVDTPLGETLPSFVPILAEQLNLRSERNPRTRSRAAAFDGGSKWLHRRRILTPTFHFNILNGFHRTFVEECELLVGTLDEHAASGKATALQPVMSRFTLSTICETSMGVKLASMAGADEYRKKLYEIGEILVHRLMRPWLISDFVCKITGYQAVLRKLLLPVHAFTTGIINQRRELFQRNPETFDDLTAEENVYTNTKKRYAMLDSLLRAEQDQLIDADGVREEVDTFTFEGHDTTASALVFIFFQLAREQTVQERIFNEIHALYDRKPQADKSLRPQDYAELKFMDRALKECLRLWPPVTFISRAITDDIVLADGALLPAGCVANVQIFDLHRDPEQFPDPERFDPDRFLPESVDKRNPYAYVPFSAGPRNCIGQKYAMMELKVVVVYTLLRFRVLPVTRLEEINFVADLVLRSTNPIEVRFERR
ncbi:cytochrome P450 4C1 [Culex quinquefasciatus]|uniref:Cytochrome P450 4C1 n=1 Tax=Culex quinquefasciatus TaxID=7176 RepID=B0XA55_CULQU|nr:cytochrome P450 4C1 [Culex quinquefasciatus]|eukprot:XP_001866527.1 cytochrome P450 4C1 [Culex quinquefasciatus]